MRMMLALRDALSRFYSTYDTYIRLFMKFMLALITFLAINAGLGQMIVLTNPMILFALSVVCAFLPSNSIVLIGMVLILGHFYGISTEAALVGGGMLVIGVMLYFGIAPHSSVPLLVTAMSMSIGFPCWSAVIFGLIGGPLSAVGVIFGVGAYHLIRLVKIYGGSLTSSAQAPAEAMVEKITVLIDKIIHQKEILVMMAALLLTLVVVWLIRRLAIKYAWMVAAGMGCICYALISVAGGVLFGSAVEPLLLFTDVALALLIAWIFQTMLFSMDYKRTENVRFEDDDYFYYVKAIPKRKVRKKKRSRRADRR